MISQSLFIAVGPCLIMASAALALLVVSLGLGRMRHASLWAVGSALAAAQWLVLAMGGGLGVAEALPGLTANLFALASLALLVEGFRFRRMGRAASTAPLLVVTGIAALLLAWAAFAPGVPLRWAIYPLISMVLLVWAARLAVTPAAPASRTEVTVVSILLAIAAVHLAAFAIALGEQAGVASHTTFARIYFVAAEPAAAARALCMLMIIAFDYATELRRLLHTDPLTGVLNRQGFDHAVRTTLERRPRHLSLAIADIDFFKQVNDLHGHAIGDATLAAFAARLAEEVGRDGAVARVGGEEFALLLPGLAGAEARDRIEAIRAGLGSVRISDRPALRVAASFGIAERRPREESDALIERADAALYLSKRHGRDRTTMAASTD